MSLKHFLLLGFCILFGVTACKDESVAPIRPTSFSPPPIAWQRPTDLIQPQNASSLSLLGVLAGHQDSPFKLFINPSNQQVASLGGDNQLIVWNMASGRSLQTLSNQLFLEAFFLPDSTHLLTIDSTQKLQVWSILEGAIQAEVITELGQLTSSALSPDGTVLAVGFQTGEVVIIDIPTLTTQTSFAAHPAGQPVRTLFYNADGSYLYSMGQEGISYYWDTTSWQQGGILEEQISPPLNIGIAPDHSLVAVARSTNLDIYNLANGILQTTITIPPIQSIAQISFSADNAWVAIGGNIDSVTVFDVTTGELVIALRGHGPNFKSLAFSPDRQLIATGMDGSGAFLWDLSGLISGAVDGSQQEVQIPRATLSQAAGLQLSQLAWSPKGDYILLADRRGPIYAIGIP